ncbi:MAG: transcriptional regulator [bacterium]
MILEKIKELLDCQILCGSDQLQIDVISAKASDLMSDVLGFSEPGKLLLTGLTNIQVIRTCDIAGICAVIFVRGKQPSTETVELSKDCGIALLTTSLSMFDSCGILYANGIKGVTIKSKK